jgi:copper chaperone CopZ
MCCTEEAEQVEAVCSRLPGVIDVRALVAAERVDVTFDPKLATADGGRSAIACAGFLVGDESQPQAGRGSVLAGWRLALLIGAVICSSSSCASRTGWRNAPQSATARHCGS